MERCIKQGITESASIEDIAAGITDKAELAARARKKREHIRKEVLAEMRRRR